MDLQQDSREREIADAYKRFKQVGKDPNNREDVLAVLFGSNEQKDLIPAFWLLPDPLPQEAVARAMELATHPKPEVRGMAFLAVEKALRNEGCQFYIDCLEHPMFRDKWHAMWALIRHGDETTVPAMAKRTRQIINTRKGAPHLFHNGESELTKCLDFLHRYRDHKEVEKTYCRMEERWEILDDREVFWLVDQLDAFRHPDLHRDRHCLPAIDHSLPYDHGVFGACESGKIAEVAAFLDSGVSVYAKHGNRPSLLATAITNGDIPMIELLVSRGLNVERPIHGFREFPILRAIQKKQWAVVDYILSLGIGLNREDEYGTSIFRIACCGITPPEWIVRMIELGADIHHRWRGETPLFEAARGQALDVLDALWKQGTDINGKNSENKTPLIVSAQGGKEASVRWLIDHGADLRHVEAYGRDAPYWAQKNGHGTIADLLRRKLSEAD